MKHTTEQIRAAAERFDALLRQYDEDAYLVARRYNAAHPADSTCAMHDFCDANVFMAEALEQVLGLKCEPASDQYSATFNRVYAEARLLWTKQETR